MAAAFELTQPRLQGKYRVTVYQLGWRLGGKGASGRGPADRIEEHGLHLWMGFYENAFRMIRECYAELNRDPAVCRIAKWNDAFAPDHYCGVMDHAPDGRWSPWTVTFPATAGLPGDPDFVGRRWTVADYLQRSVSLVRTLLETIARSAEPAAQTQRTESPIGSAPGELQEWMRRLMGYGQLATLSGLIQALRVLDEVVRLMPRFPGELILQFHEAVATAARSQLENLTRRDTGLRRLGEIIDLVLAVIRGMVRSRLVLDPRGFDAIDDYDCREWLLLNGASERSVNSGFLRALYDLAFAYENGDVERPRIAAGQSLRGALRAFFTYRGAFFWKMQAGMGDVVFAPLYEVLERRGVQFEFFHRLTNVGLAAQGPGEADGKSSVETLEFDIQASVRSGGSYRPLVDVRGLPCWPAEPDWSQLANGPRLKREGWQFESHWEKRKVGTRVLKVGHDFDFVVIAVGGGAVPFVARELIEREPRWREWAAKAKSVPTQALQLWLDSDIHQLGWKGPSINISGYVEPFDTWADMPQLIAEEKFPEPVKAVAYFCSVLPDASSRKELEDPNYPERRRNEVRDNAIRFLNEDIHELWPNAVEKGRFRWERLVAPDVRARGARGEARIDSQFLTANVDPTARYCLSLPGTLKLRPSPLDEAFDNLTVAGDWTDCGFNEGCVEAAVMSGKLASHALSQSPPLEEIVGFDHP
jgi:uncharacterized protein with NAD-binding domain and iron-sulfur cluster